MKHTESSPNENLYAETAGESKSLRIRSKTFSRKQMARDNRREERKGESLEAVKSWHPKTRADCYEMPRPCLVVSCRHNLYLDVNDETGSVKLNFPDKEIWELEETCSLDIAERGGVTLEDVGSIMNLTRERIRQVEISGLQKLKASELARSDGVKVYAEFDPHGIEGE